MNSNLDELMKTNSLNIFQPDCIRKKTNWNKSDAKYKFDSESFDPEMLLNDVEDRSPKLEYLLENIQKLDAEDKSRDKKQYKHFIFCDVKSGNSGARMLSSAFIANGYTLGYSADKKKSVESVKSKDSGKNSDNVLNKRSYNSLNNIKNEKDRIIKANMTIGGADTNQNNKKKKPENIYKKVELIDTSKLIKNSGKNFYLLSSSEVYNQSINVKMKKEILSNFNKRPSNIHGEEIRFIIMDSGFKEGIDLFDIKYIHIFEPSVNTSDQKQVIGRGTRTCGQQGLTFHPTYGWPLHVFIYDMSIPSELRSQFLDAGTTSELYLKSLNIDVRMAKFAADVEETTQYGSVDYELNIEVHKFKIAVAGQEGGAKAKKLIIDKRSPIVINTDTGLSSHIQLPSGQFINGVGLKPMGFDNMRKYIHRSFNDCKWKDVKMENMCEDKTVGGSKRIIYTPTQNFVKRYFTPQCPVRGMLLWHSTGTGKTCSAIAAASTNFDPQGYTILWVTRTTLKNDIWKNMFEQICNEQIRNMVADGITLPEEHAKRMRLLSKAWKIRPISYKQFSNLVSQENNYYNQLVNINGKEDPLRKTLLIIDEAHKLYGGGDLSSNERPDMLKLHNALLNSYAVSGHDSVRLLLMTATPITETPMEIIKLINLCKPMDDQFPDNFTTFSNEYLNDSGGFTSDGRIKYLDKISGHISYLNREKDARQFAQPQITHVLVPLVKNVKDVTNMDKRFMRHTFNKDIQDLKTEIDDENAKINTELLDLDSNRFLELRDICDDYDGIIKKGCLKISNQKIRELVKEARSHSNEIKDQIKKIRGNIREKRSLKTQALKEMDEKLKDFPEELLEFKKSMYYTLKYECVKTVNETTKFDDYIKTHPKIADLNSEITEYDEQLTTLDNALLLFIKTHKTRTKELRHMLRRGNLNELEYSVVNSILKDTIKQYNKTRKERSKNLTIETNKIISAQSKIKKRIRKKRSTLKKTVNVTIRDVKTRKKEKAKEEKELRKTLRKQGELREEFKDGLLKDLMDKYKGEIQTELDQKMNDLQNAENEKVEKQKEIEHKKAEKQKEIEHKKAEKQRNITLKRQEKESKKQARITKKKR